MNEEKVSSTPSTSLSSTSDSELKKKESKYMFFTNIFILKKEEELENQLISGNLSKYSLFSNIVEKLVSSSSSTTSIEEKVYLFIKKYLKLIREKI